MSDSYYLLNDTAGMSTNR